jgi:hypothetical protein
MPSLYPSHRCQVCNGAHDLYYAGRELDGPNLGRPYYYSCPKLPGPMRVTAGDWWKPVKKKPADAIEVERVDGRSTD